MILKHKTFFYNSLSILQDKIFYTEASLRGGNDEKICTQRQSQLKIKNYLIN